MNEYSQELDDGTFLYGWESEPPLTPFAPSYTYYFVEKKIFTEKECEEWEVYLLKQEQILLNKYRTSPQGDGQTGLGVTSITSRFTHYNVLKFDFDYIEHLKSKIFDSICCLLEVSDNTDWKETLYANSWFNVMRKDESMNTHSHGYHKNSFYGFHLTITAHETFTSYYHPVKFQEDSFHVPNKIGYLTLFPNYVPHSVSPNRYETPRITIAGDIYASTWLNAKDMLTYTNKNLIEIGNYDINKL